MKIQLTNDSTPREILSILTDYLPFLTNIAEIINDLKALDISNDSIKRVLSGGSACAFGEIVSPRFTSLKVIVSSALVSLAEIEGTYRVCLDGMPFDDFIAQEIHRQNELESTSKEELAREIGILRSTIASSTARIKALEDHITTLKRGIEH